MYSVCYKPWHIQIRLYITIKHWLRTCLYQAISDQCARETLENQKVSEISREYKMRKIARNVFINFIIPR